MSVQRRRRLSDRERWLRAKPESDFQREVLEAAGYTGWLRFHDHDARRDNEESGVDPGFPDTVLVHPIRLRIIFAELKRETEKPSGRQLVWLGALMLISKLTRGIVQVYVWRPSDMDRILEVLQG